MPEKKIPSEIRSVVESRKEPNRVTRPVALATAPSNRSVKPPAATMSDPSIRRPAPAKTTVPTATMHTPTTVMRLGEMPVRPRVLPTADPAVDGLAKVAGQHLGVGGQCHGVNIYRIATG